MPQLDQIDTFISQIFWLFACLGFVYLFLSQLAVPKLSRVIETRENTISSDINTAEQMKNKVKGFEVASEKKFLENKAEAFSVISAASKQAEKNYEESISKSEEDIKKKLEEAEKEISLERTKAEAELNKMYSTIVDEIVLKVSGVKADKTKVEKLLKTGS